MADLCNESHPEYDDVSCDKTVPCFYFHSSAQRGGVAWGTCPEPPKKTSARGKPLLDEMAGDARPSVHVGPVALDILKNGTYNRSEYEGQVKDPAWVQDTEQTFHEFLLARDEPFTTPEDLWPLVDAPPEMREMVQVVRWALREGFVEEIAAKRLNDVYHTRDGQEFKMNKLVPIYRSLISG